TERPPPSAADLAFSDAEQLPKRPRILEDQVDTVEVEGADNPADADMAPPAEGGRDFFLFGRCTSAMPKVFVRTLKAADGVFKVDPKQWD
ncbi:unnamed protein product, partial [Effrenium voratum]